jgi:hypothetical protein
MAPGIRRMTTDYERRIHRIELTDGMEHEEAFSDRMATLTSNVRRLSLAVAERELTVTLPAGDDVVLDLGGPGGGDMPPDGRPVLYLDQNHWVLLTQVQWSPEKVTRPGARQAAETLIRMTRARAVILPRTRELRAAMAGEEQSTADAFRLEPEALFATPPGPHELREPIVPRGPLVGEANRLRLARLVLDDRGAESAHRRQPPM